MTAKNPNSSVVQIPAPVGGAALPVSVFQACPTAMALISLSDGTYSDVNAGFEGLLGWSRKELLGHTSAQVGLDSGGILESVSSGSLGLGFMLPAGLEVPVTRRDGTILASSLSVTLVSDGEGPSLLLTLSDLGPQAATLEALGAANEHLVQTVLDAFGLLGRVVELRDPYTQRHQQRVALLSFALAVELGLEPASQETLVAAAQVHDIGKLRVPSEMLSKPGRLDDVEMTLVRQHAEYGYQILKETPFALPLAETVRNHHERLDGSGYPRGLAGAEIPFLSRVLAVADVVEAMSSHRPYRPALGVEAALEELGTHPELYDGDVVGACLSLSSRGVLPM